MKNSRTQSTKLLAIVSGLNLLIGTVFSIFVGRRILVQLGSEYNGINVIATQFLNIIALFEGGLTAASFVAILKPYAQQDMETVNQIFAETSYKFTIVSVLALGIGIIAAFIYSLFVETTVSYWIVVIVLLLGLVNFVFNLGIVAKYRLIFQVSQSEHLSGMVGLITNILSQVGTLCVLEILQDIVAIRAFSTIMTLVSGFLTIWLFNRRYPMVKKVRWDRRKRIFGTKDVMIGKIVGTIHSSATVLFLSVFSSAALTSVYGVYNSVINMVVSVTNIAITSPQNALGQIFHQGEEDRKRKIVLEFEYIVILILTVIFVPLGVMIVPFVKIYTKGVTDVEYVNYLLAMLMVASTYFQLIHIPAGSCIYVSGKFTVAKKIQEVALVLLLVGNLVLGNVWGMYGFLASVMVCNIALMVMEIGYVHKNMIKGTGKTLFSRWVPNAVVMLLLLGGFVYIVPRWVDGLVSWIIAAAGVTMVSALVTIGVNMLVLKAPFMEVVQRFKVALFKK